LIVDSSALVAIINAEPEAFAFLSILSRSNDVKISAVTAFEFGMVVDRYRRPSASAAADRLLVQIEAEVVSVDAVTAQAARAAYVRFGKGFHPARLNFGDCFGYALAKETGEPLLFKGNDFAQTDVISVV
jgi:ribonuclease VapC